MSHCSLKSFQIFQTIFSLKTMGFKTCHLKPPVLDKAHSRPARSSRDKSRHRSHGALSPNGSGEQTGQVWQEKQIKQSLEGTTICWTVFCISCFCCICWTFRLHRAINLTSCGKKTEKKQHASDSCYEKNGHDEMSTEDIDLFSNKGGNLKFYKKKVAAEHWEHLQKQRCNLQPEQPMTFTSTAYRRFLPVALPARLPSAFTSKRFKRAWHSSFNSAQA